jgi:hypothetical protein
MNLGHSKETGRRKKKRFKPTNWVWHFTFATNANLFQPCRIQQQQNRKNQFEPQTTREVPKQRSIVFACLFVFS